MTYGIIQARIGSTESFALRIILTASVILLSAPSAFPCSCMRIGPACEAAWLQADAVFVGRVYWSSLLPTERFGTAILHRIVKVKILEPFVGSSSGWVSIETGAGGGDCGYNFSWGEKYLIYAHKDPKGFLTTSICTRTQKVGDAKNDLEYLRSLSGLAATGRVYGTVKQYTFDPSFKPIEVSIMSPYGAGPEEKVVSMRALTNTVVRLSGTERPGEQIARAGQNGEFGFESLVPGRYKISVDLPAQMKPWESREITVPAKGCSEISIRTAYNGRLRGSVTDEGGAAIPYVDVEVVWAAEAERAVRAFRWINANKDGAFEIGPLPPDVYAIGVNIVKYSGDRTRPKTYYPGTSNLQAAKRIQVREGQLVEGLNFRLGPTAPSHSQH